jgi:TonB family protein
MPQYPGGDRAFITWVAKNYKYPKEAIEAGVSGRLIVQFVVEKDGSLKNVKCVRDIGYGTGTEAVRVVSAAAKWKPGIQNGRPVRVQYTLPLNLQMPVKMDSEASSPYIISSYGISNPSLIIVDGKEVTMEYLKQLKPEDIEKIDVLKDKSATEKYSEKGKNGVVIITLKTKSN